MIESSFFFIEQSLLSFVIFIGCVNEGVECVVEMLVLHRFPYFLHHDEELLCDHVVDSETQDGNCFIGFFEDLLLSLNLVRE